MGVYNFIGMEEKMTGTTHPKPPSNSQQRLLTNIPITLGILLMASDILSFVSANYWGNVITTNLYDSLLIQWDSSFLKPQKHIYRDLYLVLAIVVSMIIWGKGLYTNRTPWWGQIRFILNLFLFSVVLHTLLNFALKIHEPMLLIFSKWVIAFAFMVVFRSIIYKISSGIKRWKIPTVIISDQATAEDLIYAFSSDMCTGYDVKNVFLRAPADSEGFDLSIIPGAQKSLKICYGQDDHEPFIKAHPNFFYIVSLDTFRDVSRESIIKTLNENNVPFAIVPALSRVNLYQMEPRYFFGHDVVMLYVGNSAPQIFGISASRLIKRGMDICVSFAALLVLSPLLISVSALLKMEGQGGTLFYGGKRIGKNGRYFNCWKFRSMEPNSDHLLHDYLDKNPDMKADWEKFRKLPNDPRVTTRTARFIRKASIDELPQLWNILTGDMSLVGPRPILEDEQGYFDNETLQEYLSVRPGLTGLWQVSGRNQTSFKRRIHWDSWYVRNWSLFGDIVILIKTPLVLLSRKGAS